MSLRKAGSNYNFVLGETLLGIDLSNKSLQEEVEEGGNESVDIDLDFILPKLNICIIVVGTHGDVLPFCALANELQEIGHRVRLASHEVHRRTVTSRSIEFFPLAGDPKLLSQWTVQSGGNITGEIRQGVQDPSVLAAKDAMVKSICRSCWGAVTGTDPYLEIFDDTQHQAIAPFVANAVIANPPCMGHIHVCEALGIPLHIMFPQVRLSIFHLLLIFLCLSSSFTTPFTSPISSLGTMPPNLFLILTVDYPINSLSIPILPKPGRIMHPMQYGRELCKLDMENPSIIGELIRYKCRRYHLITGIPISLLSVRFHSVPCGVQVLYQNRMIGRNNVG
jgi:hypothetical protein